MTPINKHCTQQKHFNVVFEWEDLEYKLLNVYNIEYFKGFEYCKHSKVCTQHLPIRRQH